MQRAEFALKYDKLYRKVARDRWASTKFTSESGQEAINKRWDDDNITSEIRPPSAGAGSSTSQQLAEQFGVSSSTLERVRRGNKENNGSNSGADADDDNITRHRSFQATN